MQQKSNPEVYVKQNSTQNTSVECVSVNSWFSGQSSAIILCTNKLNQISLYENTKRIQYRLTVQKLIYNPSGTLHSVSQGWVLSSQSKHNMCFKTAWSRVKAYICREQFNPYFATCQNFKEIWQECSFDGLFICMSACLPVCLSVCPPVCLSACLSACLFVFSAIQVAIFLSPVTKFGSHM